jgi:hypothetical protein
MFPKATLPYTAFVARRANRVERLLLRQRSRETVLDQPPARREIMVARRQAPDGVQMIGKHHEGINRKFAAVTNRGDSFAQDLYVIEEQSSPTVQQIDCEEPTTTCDESSTIIRHGMKDSTIPDRRTRGGGLRLRLIRPTNPIASMILELVFLVDLAVALEPARHGLFAAERSCRIGIA